MNIHIVERGDTLSSIASEYGVSLGLLAVWNGLKPPYSLVVGQAILILSPSGYYTVREGDTLTLIARRFGLTARELYANNPNLMGGIEPLFVGQTLVLGWNEPKLRDVRINSYAYPYITDPALYGTLPYLTYLAPFTYGLTREGGLIQLDDERLITVAESYGTSPLMHLSTLTESGSFSNELASALFANEAAQERLIEEMLATMRTKGYEGLDIDFEFIFPEEASAYAAFIRRARLRLNEEGYPVIAALAPKSSRDQRGIGYEGHDYALIGAAANEVFVMTYEWGYTYGPPLAVAPIASVRRVLDFAVSEIPAEKIFMGLPNYGYDWALPYKPGETRARSIGNEEAISIARAFGAEIQFDEASATPFFHYKDNGVQHEVWFEDARSYFAKLRLIDEYGFAGAGIWNSMRPFTQGYLVLQNLYRVAAFL